MKTQIRVVKAWTATLLVLMATIGGFTSVVQAGKVVSMWVVTLDKNEEAAKAISWDNLPDSHLDMWNVDPKTGDCARTAVLLQIIDLKTNAVIGTWRPNYAGATLKKGGRYGMKATGITKGRTTYHIRRYFTKKG